MKQYFLGDVEIFAGHAFEANGAKHPSNWAECWTEEDFSRWGITWRDVEDPPAPRRMVEKWVIMERLSDAQLDAAVSAMTRRQLEKWRMPGYPSVYADDPEVTALIQHVGADPQVVLA